MYFSEYSDHILTFEKTLHKFKKSVFNYCFLFQCFLCRTRTDFEELCITIEQKLSAESQPLFEMCEKRPAHWGPGTADIDLQNTSLFTGNHCIDFLTFLLCK